MIQEYMLTLVLFLLLSHLFDSLPGNVMSSNNIVSFHHHSKTHLFRLAYPSMTMRLANPCSIGTIEVCQYYTIIKLRIWHPEQERIL